MPPAPAADGSEGQLLLRARTRYRVSAADASKVVCHRKVQGQEQYLIRWRTARLKPHDQPVFSWHGLPELWACLNLVQTYITSPSVAQNIRDQAKTSSSSFAALQPLAGQKRKAPGDPALVTPAETGIPTPGPSSTNGESREPSVISISSSSSGPDPGATVYNGILQRKAGYLVAKHTGGGDSLPSQAMREAAATTSVSQGALAVRQRFLEMLKVAPGVELENYVDDTTPSLAFTFINKYVIRPGVRRLDDDSMEGCSKLLGNSKGQCRPNMGQNIGCEYTSCACLELAAVNEDQLQKDPERYEDYCRRREAGEPIDTSLLPKKFPYRRAHGGGVPPLLETFYRRERHAIYECNQKCQCGPICKSRVVQNGRKVGLTIFKTKDRGWGVKCNEELLEGEFIDTYLGEVITNDEAQRREQLPGHDTVSYQYSLDKFVGDIPELTEDTCYVVDGQSMGGATRFMNHSCEPNCRQYTVSYNKHDLWVYDLAFFASEYIPAGTELTFDYMDKDELEEVVIVREREAAALDPSNKDKKRCRCGAPKCRWFLWV